VSGPPRLGVNIDHVATIRNARGGAHPDPVRAARLAVEAGAEGITAHLREDRRHIGDDDIRRLVEDIDCPLNLEMAATEEMLAIALRHKPPHCCIVPEKREERTTEGGLDAAGQHNTLAPFVRRLREEGGIRVSLFIEPDPVQVAVAEALGAQVVEFHTGRYVEHVFASETANAQAELTRIRDAAANAHDRGLEAHAGHGITFNTVSEIAAIPAIKELNIGHFLMGEAIFIGLDAAVKRMKALMAEARP